MKHLETCCALRQFRKNIPASQSIGFVPTMGCLHEGHFALIRQAQAECDQVVVSLFVNPLQFNCPSDYEKYPQQQAEDFALLKAHDVTAVFTPTHTDIYPKGECHTSVDVVPLSQQLEGASRPGHFQGVATVVSILFHLVQPHRAYFGEKDFQQLVLIRHMVRALHFDIEICAVPTVRNAQGLALSSRNARLSELGKQQATYFYQSLCWLARELRTQKTPPAALAAQYRDKLETQGFLFERLDIVDAATLEPLQGDPKHGVILAAVWLEDVRLIDNILLSRDF